MKSGFNLFLTLITIALVFTILACKTAQVQNTNTGSGSGSGSELRTDCGVVIDGSVENPVNNTDGIRIRVQSVSGPNQVIYIDQDNPDSAPQLLKLQGISGASSGKSQFAIDYLESVLRGTLYFFPASSDCQAVVDGGGVAQVGSVISSNGTSVNEEMVKSGLVDIESSDSCGADKIAGCLSALRDTTPVSEGELNKFLWKPVSDSNGKLAVHTGPSGTTVIVNGETGTNQGGGNGYGSLARFSKPGCSYGSASVQVLNGRSGLPYSVGGKTTFTIPNGCQRSCLEGGQIVACSK